MQISDTISKTIFRPGRTYQYRSLNTNYINNHFISNFIKICMQFIWKVAIGHFIVFQSNLFLMFENFLTLLQKCHVSSDFQDSCSTAKKQAEKQESKSVLHRAMHPVWQNTPRIPDVFWSRIQHSQTLLLFYQSVSDLRGVSVLKDRDIYWTLLIFFLAAYRSAQQHVESFHLKIYLQINSVLR